MNQCNKNKKNYTNNPGQTTVDVNGYINNQMDTVVRLFSGGKKSWQVKNEINETSIDTHKSFVENNNPYMKSLMETNSNIRENILNNIGNTAPLRGVSDNIHGEVLKPSYVEGNNYLDFVTKVQSNENQGKISTRSNVWQNYNEANNLYPDELEAFSTGAAVSNLYSWEKLTASGMSTTSESSFNVWNVGDETNSILYKTKKLFKDRKINTIISRFGTGADNVTPIEYNGQIATQYGESRGRNLLTKEAENNYVGNHKGGYNINGYKNPYCRVWTHHYKYDSIYKTMRPFTEIDTKDGHGGHKSTATLSDVHNWKRFKTDDSSYAWKDDNSSYDKSVMSDGMVNFAPMYHTESNKKIHTKDCMFSIENLAWRDVDDYNFEKNLSWEQRGPNGGRIMWFPPYGLTFSETTQAKWNPHSFIGRGEEIYTYQDTARSGTLSFLMVVDHPSIINYVTGLHADKTAITDNDIHRYFAGCDRETLQNAAIPTPLEDEGFDVKNQDDILVDLTIKDIKAINFSIYVPQGYSGEGDHAVFTNDTNKVSFIKYLLMGSYGGYYYENGIEKKNQDSILDDNNFNDVGSGYCMFDYNPPKQEEIDKYLIKSQNRSDNKYGWLHRVDRIYQETTNLKKNKEPESRNHFNLYHPYNDISFAQFIIIISNVYNRLKNTTNKLQEKIREYIQNNEEYKNIDYFEENYFQIVNNYTEFIKKIYERKIAIKKIIVEIPEDKNYTYYHYRLFSTLENMFKDIFGKDTTIEMRTNNYDDNNTYYAYITILLNDNDFLNEESPNQIVNGESEKRYEIINVDRKRLIFHRNTEKIYTPNYENNSLQETLLKVRKKNNTLRYDQEYYFFKKLQSYDNIVYKKLVDKLQFFDPAFHSMTPEGFNGRLTFLNQCMRQGDIIISSASNMIFGAAPYCVLRIGDFYNQMIIIENMSINYDVDGGVHWDLNAEGIGVQPLLAQVQLNIKLIGGGDVSGPIRRLQNAMTFNYYANASMYDNRANERYSATTNVSVNLKKIDPNKSAIDAYNKLKNNLEQKLK